MRNLNYSTANFIKINNNSNCIKNLNFGSSELIGVKNNPNQCVRTLNIANSQINGGVFLSPKTWSNIHDINNVNGARKLDNTSIFVIKENNSNLYIGGQNFSQLSDETPTSYVARYNINTDEWSNINDINNVNGVDDTINYLNVHDSNLYVGGNFQNLSNGDDALRVSRYNINTNEWSNIHDINNVNGVDNTINYLDVHDSNLYVGGSFKNLSNGDDALGIARYNINTNEWSNIHDINNVNGIKTYFFDAEVNNITYHDNNLYVGGTRFNQLSDGTPANCITRYNIIDNEWTNLDDGQIDGVFNGGLLSNSVETSIVYDSNLYVGGRFTLFSDGITPALNIAKYNLITNEWSNVHDINNVNGVNGTVIDIQVSNNELYISGSFTSLSNGQESKYFTKYDPILNKFSTLDFDTSNGSIQSFHIKDNNLYIGGTFTTINSSSATLIPAGLVAKLNNFNYNSNC